MEGRGVRALKEVMEKFGAAPICDGGIEDWRMHLSPPETRPAGTEILRQAAVPERVYLLFDGIAKFERTASARSRATVGLRFPGWFLGAESVIAEQKAPVSVVAATDCAVRGLARERFLGLVRIDPDLSWRISQMHSRELIDRLERDGDRAQVSPVVRLKHLLHRLMNANDTIHLNKEIHFRLPVELHELAGLISVSVAQLTALLGQLQRDRLIVLRRDRLVVLDPLGLHAADPTRRDVGWPLNAG